MYPRLYLVFEVSTFWSLSMVFPGPLKGLRPSGRDLCPVTTLVEGLIGCNGHTNLISHAEQQQATLGAIDGHLQRSWKTKTMGLD